MVHVQEGGDGRDANHEGRGIRLYAFSRDSKNSHGIKARRLFASSSTHFHPLPPSWTRLLPFPLSRSERRMKERKKSSPLDSEYLLARRPILDEATPEDDERDSAISGGLPSVMEREEEEEEEVDLDAKDTAGLEGPRCRLSLHSAYSLPWDSTPFSGFWRLDHRSLEATTCGGRKEWLAEPSPSPRRYHARAQAGTSCCRISPPFLSSSASTLCRSRTQRDNMSNKPAISQHNNSEADNPTLPGSRNEGLSKAPAPPTTLDDASPPYAWVPKQASSLRGIELDDQNLQVIARSLHAPASVHSPVHVIPVHVTTSKFHLISKAASTSLDLGQCHPRHRKAHPPHSLVFVSRVSPPFLSALRSRHERVCHLPAHRRSLRVYLHPADPSIIVHPPTPALTTQTLRQWRVTISPTIA
ncbi:hypothetical protein ARMGADRAFT_1091730 [Armillaria gallica]|uniref:Uncharacterized protein n=1 Tax=Armillaria gallica TaxID=47427 RepID=A0A2H3CRD4_ARMGA|nr:hypothetical protein ARMGADRAFT_1091730 [Armillaria gallica]